jgi:predicted flap endonuclease-1-like 5' DNA nuclease
MFLTQASFPAFPLIQDAPPVSPTLLVIIAILLVILFIWLLLRDRRAREEAASAQNIRAAQAETITPPPARPVNLQPAEIPNPAYRSGSIAVEPVEDDLEIIEGIGPKIASVLKQAGVTSFAQLAAMNPDKINEILRAANLRLADPTSWPEQARLAANGDMTALQSLQDRLKGGR